MGYNWRRLQRKRSELNIELPHEEMYGDMIKIGIIGTGGMAHYHVNAFNKIKGCKIVSCCDTNEERVNDFAKKYGISKFFTNVDDMLDSVRPDAVSVVTPDSSHAEVSLKAIERGLNVLCEKPLAANLRDAQKMAKAARRKGIITGVNFSYRNSPAVQYAARLVKKGGLGRIIHVEASYLQSWLVSNAWGEWRTTPSRLWRLSTKHHSKGTLGDVGVHIYDMASFIIGDFSELQCILKTFDKGVKKIGEYILDANDSFISMIKFKNGALGAIHSSRWGTGYANSLRIRVFGDKGGLEIDLDKSSDTLRLCKGKRNIDKAIWKDVKCPKVPTMHERFINSIKRGKQDKPDFEVGAKVQAYLDKSFQSNESGEWVKV